MNDTRTDHADARADAPTGDPFLASLQAMAEQAGQAIDASAQRFQEMLPRVLARYIADPDVLAQAVEDGGFVLGDCTAGIRFAPESMMVEFFADIGEPAPYTAEANYRTALEINLTRLLRGVILGLHPQSGRLVATTSAHQMLLADEDAYARILDTLTEAVADIREGHLFELA